MHIHFAKEVPAEMLRIEHRDLADTQAKFIETVCAKHRKGNGNIKLVRPTNEQDLYLIVNGKPIGYFDHKREGLVFVQV